MAVNTLHLYFAAVLGCSLFTIAHLLAWSFYYRIFFAQARPPKWYYFWDQRTGARGALLGAVLIFSFFGLLFYFLLY